MKTVYLAGGIFGLDDDAVLKWRRYAQRALAKAGHDWIDPTAWDFRGREAGNEARIIEGDYALILKSTCLLVNATRPSWGTAMEIHFAYRHRREVFAFVGLHSKKISPWLRYHCTHVAETMDEALDILFAGTPGTPR